MVATFDMGFRNLLRHKDTKYFIAKDKGASSSIPHWELYFLASRSVKTINEYVTYADLELVPMKNYSSRFRKHVLSHRVDVSDFFVGSNRFPVVSLGNDPVLNRKLKTAPHKNSQKMPEMSQDNLTRMILSMVK